MSSSNPSSRYSSIEPYSSSFKTTSNKPNSINNFPSNSTRRRNSSDPSTVSALAKIHQPTLGTMVKKFIETRRNPNNDFKKVSSKGSNNGFLNLNLNKLLNRSGSTDRATAKTLTDVSNNTRTLGMVLRSERELIKQNKEYENVIAELRIFVEEKNLEVDKLKDLCLRQREEIKALKDEILFSGDLEHGFKGQGFELKEARKIIPCLQKQVSSLSGKIQCLAVDIAEVKADRYTAKNCFDGHINSPTTPKYDVLEYNSGDALVIDDINPCLTPCFSKGKSKGHREACYNSPSRNGHIENSSNLSPTVLTDSYGEILSRSSEHYQKQRTCTKSSKKICMSDERKWGFGKRKSQTQF